MGLRSKAVNDIPAGTIWMYYGAAQPPGWLFCDGQSTAGYGALAAQVGANVPDLRGRGPIGAGAGAGLTARTLGTAYGVETVAPAITNLPLHYHGSTSHSHGLASHSHTGINHGHNSTGHVHGGSHDHGPHSHGGACTLVGTNDYNHTHQTAGGQGGAVPVGGPGGYFTGQYVNFNNAYAVYNGFSTAGPSAFGNEAPVTSGANNVGGNPLSGAIVSAEGSGTAIGTLPPTLSLQFIIKT